VTREDWRDKSNCRDLPPGQFFADRGRTPNDATSPCTTCPVRSDCLDFALSSPWEPYGIWGGLQPKEIKPLWRSRNPNPHPQHHFEVPRALVNEKGRSNR